MWCPDCMAEYDVQAESCPECGAALEIAAPKPEWGKYIPGELLRKWPKSAAGEPVAPIFLKHCTSVDMEDQLLSGMLDAYDIPSLMVHPSDGSFGKVMLGMSGNGTDIYVPETMYELAIELISREVDDANE